jgi:IgA Peptidase M64
MPTPKKHLTVFASLLIWLCFTPAASAEPFETVIFNGRTDQRIDIVIMGDGYTEAEMTQYKFDVQNFVTALFEEEPFREYRRYFNVHRVDVVSNQSGCDDPFTKTSKDTKLNCSHDLVVNQQAGKTERGRIITIDLNAAQAVLDASVPPSHQQVGIVLSNTKHFGGSQLGRFAISYARTVDWNPAIHEVGHVFGDLRDEYVDNACSPKLPPDSFNVTDSLANIPWAMRQRRRRNRQARRSLLFAAAVARRRPRRRLAAGRTPHAAITRRNRTALRLQTVEADG